MLVQAYFQSIPADWLESDGQNTNKVSQIKSCIMHLTEAAMMKNNHSVVTWSRKTVKVIRKTCRFVLQSVTRCYQLCTSGLLQQWRKRPLLRSLLTDCLSGFLQSSNRAELTEVKISCQSEVSNCCRGSKRISRLHLLPFKKADQVNVEAGVVGGKQCLVCACQGKWIWSF